MQWDRLIEPLHKVVPAQAVPTTNPRMVMQSVPSESNRDVPNGAYMSFHESGLKCRPLSSRDMSWPNARHYVPHLHRDQPRAQHCTLSGNSLAADPTVGQTQPNLLVEERRAEADGLRQRGDVVVLLEPRDRAEELEALVPHLRDIGLQHGTACCNTVQHVATQYGMLQHRHVATRYSMLQHGTACCNTVQHVATRYSMLQP
jgi:hypothetical protein